MTENGKTVPLQVGKIVREDNVFHCPIDNIKIVERLAEYKGVVAKAPICPLCLTVYLPTDIVSPFYKGNAKLEDFVTPKETLALPEKIAALPKEPPTKKNSPGTIMTAAVHAPGQTDLYFITITDDPGKQDSKNGKYWIRREIALVVCAAVFTKHKEIQYDGADLIVKVFYKGPEFEKNEKHFNALSGSKNVVPIYVWDSIPSSKKEQAAEITAIVYVSEKQLFAPLTVYYSSNTNEYFVRASEYKQFLRIHGVPINKAFLCTESQKIGVLNPESKLKMLGYSVGNADALSSIERQEMLKKFIDAKLLTKKEIMDHLQFLIDLNDGKLNFMDSVGKWKEDLKYVSNYIPKNSKPVFGEIIKGHSG